MRHLGLRITAITMIMVVATGLVWGEQAAAAAAPHVVFLIGEGEYKTHETLPKFARDELIGKLKFRCTFVHADPKDGNSFPGIEAIETADLLILSVRRRALKVADLARVRKYLAAGRPLVGVRTASHAFHTKGKHPRGHAEWQEFDPEVLGGHYVGHHGNKLVTTVRTLPAAAKHPILAGVSTKPFDVGGSLYRVNPLKKACVPLMSGRVKGAPLEPVAWTHSYRGGRIFYTSLGHPSDFQLPAFRRLLRNAVLWSLKRETGDTK
jgi:type 1 glutamine amidotransferase